MQHGVEHAAGLAGLHHRDVEAVEHLGVPASACESDAPCSTSRRTSPMTFGELLVLGLLGQDVRATGAATDPS